MQVKAIFVVITKLWFVVRMWRIFPLIPTIMLKINTAVSCLPLACDGVVVVSQCFFEVCLFPRSSRPKWSALVVCGLLLISNFFERITVNRSHVCCPINQNHVRELTKAWISCKHFAVLCRRLVMFPLACRRFGLSPFCPYSFVIRTLF